MPFLIFALTALIHINQPLADQHKDAAASTITKSSEKDSDHRSQENCKNPSYQR